MTAIRIFLLTFVVVLAGAFGWIAYQWSSSNEALLEKPYGVAFDLVDQHGDRFTDKELHSQPTALFFGFTHCPEICPTTLFELDGWLKQVDPDGDEIQSYFVTIDPERDPPEILDSYVSNVSKRIIGVSGDPEKVRDMARGFKVYFKKVPTDEDNPDENYTMDHTASVFLLDKDGRFRGTISFGEDGDTAVKKLQNLISG
ncbi:SCO family protein [Hoeflea sp. WL0058]|uniref:SCO family protein n=1 Tax=Flavimaribacter sediminis TaxID=2865987 RepID=A0AAE2ZGN0_9HYPH|nr:SCO family protein [Flavimaribacter sediminis]MBW8635789.1 SCO family protein [Flavimaribacter sediminis]